MDDAKKDRLYAGMTPKEIQAHELWVTKYKVDKAEQAERQAVERRKRTARLKVMTDEDVVASFLPGDADPKELLADLRDAGFVRADLGRIRKAYASLGEAVRRIVDQEPDYGLLNRLIMDAATNLSLVEETI